MEFPKQARNFLIVVLIPLSFVWGFIIYNIDYSDENFERDRLKSRLERMEEFKCTCKLFEGRQFEGTVKWYDKRLIKGAADIIVIKLNENSDSIFFEDNEVKDLAGNNSYSTYLGKLLISINPGRGPDNIKIGDHVKKMANSDTILFTGYNREAIYNPFKSFQDVYKSCLEVDTMDVLYNLRQFYKYDSLSRHSRLLDPRAKEYIIKRLKEQ